MKTGSVESGAKRDATVHRVLAAAALMVSCSVGAAVPSEPGAGIAERVGSALATGAKVAADAIERGTKAAASGVERGATATARAVERGMTAAANGLARGAQAVTNGIERATRRSGEAAPDFSGGAGAPPSSPKIND